MDILFVAYHTCLTRLSFFHGSFQMSEGVTSSLRVAETIDEKRVYTLHDAGDGVYQQWMDICEGNPINIWSI